MIGDTYKVGCDELDTVLLLKCYNKKEENDLFKRIAKSIDLCDSPFTVASYQKTICDFFIADSENFFKKLEKNIENASYPYNDIDEVIPFIYEAIVKLYPPFRLEVVCNNLNHTTFTKISKTNKVPLEQETTETTTIKDILKTKQIIKKNVIGQEEAIEALIRTAKLHIAGLAGHSSLFFVGPTGVGKTELAKVFGSLYSGNFFKIDCASFSEGHEKSGLLGSPPGYVGSNEKSILSVKAQISNKWVFLFDEIEKAHWKFFDFLLALMDDGKATDAQGLMCDFSKSIFIFTSNEGLSDIKWDGGIGFGNSKSDYKNSKDVILKSIKNKFKPEFINRLDDIIFFNPLTREEVNKIIKLQLKELPIEPTKKVIDYIIDNSYSEEYGARNVKRFIKKEISVKLADAILANRNRLRQNYKPVIRKGTLYISRISREA